MREDPWGAARTALELIPAHPPGVEGLTRRTRTLRVRRIALAGLATLVAAFGVVVPLRFLSRLGEPPEADRIGPGGSSNTASDGEESHSYRPGWFAHVDAEDGVRIEAPRDWIYRDDPTITLDPGVLFAVGSWNVPAYWEGEACGYDSVLSFLPDSAALLWVEEIRSASLTKDFVSLDAPPHLRDLHSWRAQCVPEQEVLQVRFRLDGRDFVLFAAFGQRSPASLRATADEVLGTFRTRIDEEPFPPEPNGPVVEVANGTAFGSTWTLSAYRAKDGAYSGNVCYLIVGGYGTGCADPSAVSPPNGGLLPAFYVTGETGPAGEKAFAHGIVGESVAGITLTMDDGRVFSVATLKSKAFPVAFYVIPFEGSGEQVISIEALDANGKVLQEMNLLEQRRVAEERARGG